MFRYNPTPHGGSGQSAGDDIVGEGGDLHEYSSPPAAGVFFFIPIDLAVPVASRLLHAPVHGVDAYI